MKEDSSDIKRTASKQKKKGRGEYVSRDTRKWFPCSTPTDLRDPSHVRMLSKVVSGVSPSAVLQMRLIRDTLFHSVAVSQQVGLLH